MSAGVTKPIKRRTMIMSGIILFLFFGVLVIQLFNIQIINHDYYEQQAINQQTAVITVNADRGTIYDRNGIVLAESATAYKVYIVPNRIAEEEKETVIDGLSGILGLKRETMENAPGGGACFTVKLYKSVV